jgi:hypothetical protein
MIRAPSVADKVYQAEGEAERPSMAWPAPQICPADAGDVAALLALDHIAQN